MAKSFLIVSFLIFICVTTIAQIYNGDLTLETQTQVDDFNFSEVRGTLLLTGSSITSLSGMNGLVKVTHNFNIEDCDALLTLNGIESLQYVGWQINVYRNQTLNVCCRIIRSSI